MHWFKAGTQLNTSKTEEWGAVVGWEGPTRLRVSEHGLRKKHHALQQQLWEIEGHRSMFK